MIFQVVAGIKYLHDQNIVHGDIKPQNLLVGSAATGEGRVVKIADFGISHMVFGSTQKLLDTAGTPAFMSPEICSGTAFSGQLADVWAVGATMFMLIYGRPPFVAAQVGKEIN
jgi:[calcium/calmodulin-dependent protein kinase] kinase